jgi:hypothetical protein
MEIHGKKYLTSDDHENHDDIKSAENHWTNDQQISREIVTVPQKLLCQLLCQTKTIFKESIFNQEKAKKVFK